MTNDTWDNQYDREHVAVWVRSLQATGFDAAAVRDELDKWTLNGMTQIYVGQYARMMPHAVARAMAELAVSREPL
jgi:hypothetical protein